MFLFEFTSVHECLLWVPTQSKTMNFRTPAQHPTSLTALLIVEGDEDKPESFLYVPDRDYFELNEAVDIIKEHRAKVI
jgi:hypothetical protein